MQLFYKDTVKTATSFQFEAFSFDEKLACRAAIVHFTRKDIWREVRDRKRAEECAVLREGAKKGRNQLQTLNNHSIWNKTIKYAVDGEVLSLKPIIAPLRNF